jgi:hypothetical protein
MKFIKWQKAVAAVAAVAGIFSNHTHVLGQAIAVETQ